jgi:hypothetical protein
VEASQVMRVREMERMMKLQDVVLKAMAKKPSWIAAAEMCGDDRTQHAAEAAGIPGFRWIRRSGSWRCIGTLRDLNVRHFHEKLSEVEGTGISYSWVRQALQGAGLMAKQRRTGSPRGLGETPAAAGMLLHTGGACMFFLLRRRLCEVGHGFR